MKNRRMLLHTDSPKKEEPPILFRLHKGSIEDAVVLWVVDQYGNTIPKGNLLKITPQGIQRYTYVNPDIPLPKDSAGRIVLDFKK